MSRKPSKRYREAAKLVDKTKAYTVSEAVGLIKTFPPAKFDQSLSISLRLGVEPRKSDQMVRGTVALPHGTGKSVRVAVFAQGEAAAAATEAGAEIVGFEDLIDKVKGGFTDFDVAIATPAAMTEVRKLGKQLGPRGLMPNPRTGTVTDDVVSAIKAVKAGRIDFKLDKNGNVAGPIGKVSFSAEALAENAEAFLDAVVRAKPATAKGRFVRSITIAATVSPGVTVDSNLYARN